jgi:hypothetical protein
MDEIGYMWLDGAGQHAVLGLAVQNIGVCSRQNRSLRIDCFATTLVMRSEVEICSHLAVEHGVYFSSHKLARKANRFS